MNLPEKIHTKFPNLVESFADGKEPMIYVKKEGVKDLIRHLKNDVEYAFDFLMDIFGIDYLSWEEKEFRFEVVYNLFSRQLNQRLFIKAKVHENDPVMESIVSIWPAADWYEREVYDMFGIRFVDHPNLKRILMYEGFQGYPLRKDYPYNKRQPLVGPVN